MPGDVSVFGWELMAVKSASMAYLYVPENTFRKADYFLDTMQLNGGAEYAYFGHAHQRMRNGAPSPCRPWILVCHLSDRPAVPDVFGLEA